MTYTGIFDTHAHYDDECFDEDRFELLDEMLTSDVSGIINCGCTVKSSKTSITFAEKYPEKIQVIHKENQGLISARRIAIDKAQGEFCVFVDSDDFIECNLLETVNSYLLKDVNIDMVIYSFNYYSDGIKNKRNRFVAEDSEIWSADNKKRCFELLATGDSIDALWIKAIKTEILKRDPIDYKKYFSKNMSEDTLQSIYPITHSKKIIYADVPLYNYRYNTASISRNFNPEVIAKKDSSHVFEEMFSVLPEWKLNTEEFKQKIYARWFSDVMYIFVKSCENAATNKEIDSILDFDWLSMMPSCVVNTFDSYVNQQYTTLYSYLVDGEFRKIKFEFFKRKLYKKVVSLKRKL